MLNYPSRSQLPRSLGVFGVGPLVHWDHRFESHSKHESISTIFCVVFPRLSSTKGFMVLEETSDSEQARGPNPRNAEARKIKFHHNI